MTTQNCYICKKPINTDKDKYMLVATYNNHGKPRTEEVFFHPDCYLAWFNGKINERLQIAQTQVMKMLGGVSGNLQTVLSEVFKKI